MSLLDYWYACLTQIRPGETSDDHLDPNCLKTLIAGGKRRESEHTNLLFDFLESRSTIFGSVY